MEAGKKKGDYSYIACVIKSQFLKILSVASFETPKFGPIATEPNIAEAKAAGQLA